MIRLYDFHESGNAYKVRLMLHQLGIPFERIELDILAGETRTPEFLEINPNGRVPALVLEDGTTLVESNAILFFLAEGTDRIPSGALGRARVLQWMFFEQYSHEPYIAVVRFWTFTGQLDAQQAELPARRDAGRRALALMDAHLSLQPFFVGGRYTIADIALYAYTHVAPEGGFDLAPHPALRHWLERVRDQPGYVSLEAARPAADAGT